MSDENSESESKGKPVKEHQPQSKPQRKKKANDIITITRGGLELKGKRKDEAKLIEQFLEMERNQNGM